METVVRIRREHAAGKPIRAISRDLRLSRKVVRKAIRAEEGAFSYQRTTQPVPKIGPCGETSMERTNGEYWTCHRIQRVSSRRWQRHADRGSGSGGRSTARGEALIWVESKCPRSVPDFPHASLPVRTMTQTVKPHRNTTRQTLELQDINQYEARYSSPL